MSGYYISAVTESLLAIYFDSVPLGLAAIVIALGGVADAIRKR